MPPRRLPTLPDPDLPPLPAALASSPGFLSMQVATRIRGRVEDVMRAVRLHPRQYHMLLVLREEGVMSQQALGQRTFLDRTTAMQAATALANAGLVDRQDDPGDRRVYRLALTPAGRARVAMLEDAISRIEDEVLAPLGDAKHTFVAQLRAILAAPDGDRGCGGDGAR